MTLLFNDDQMVISNSHEFTEFFIWTKQNVRS